MSLSHWLLRRYIKIKKDACFLACFLYSFLKLLILIIRIVIQTDLWTDSRVAVLLSSHCKNVALSRVCDMGKHVPLTCFCDFNFLALYSSLEGQY